MRKVNVNLVIPPSLVSTVVQMTSRRFEFRMRWGTTYVAKRVGKYWSVYFNSWCKDRWNTPFTKLSQLKAWFKEMNKPYLIPDEVMQIKDNPNISIEDMKKAMKSHGENFYEKYLLGDWDVKDYNTCSQCGAPVPDGHSGKCGEPCI